MPKYVTRIEEIIGKSPRQNQEMSFVSLVKTAAAEIGVIRFVKEPERGAKMILHKEKDVVCYVAEGSGSLVTGRTTHAISKGSLCHVPAGTPHDFYTERSTGMVLVYALVRTGARTSES